MYTFNIVANKRSQKASFQTSQNRWQKTLAGKKTFLDQPFMKLHKGQILQVLGVQSFGAGSHQLFGILSRVVFSSLSRK